MLKSGKRYFPLKTGVITMVIVLGLIMSLLTLILIQTLGRGYSSLVKNESAEMLNLYSEKVENSLLQVEKLSYDILCSMDMQANMLRYKQTQDKYTRHLASTELANQLLMRTISEPLVVSVDYIFEDGYDLNVAFRTVTRHDAAYLTSVYQRAVSANGSHVWAVNPDNMNMVSSVRLIKDISGSNGFIPLGVLVINLRTDKLLSYNPVTSGKYRSGMVCLADGLQLSPPSIDFPETGIQKILSGKTNGGEIRIGNSDYLYAVRKSDRTNWQFINIMNSDSLFADLRKNQTWYMLSFVLLMLGILVLATRSADLICRPVTRLSALMTRVRNGVYEPLQEIDNPVFHVEEIVHLTSSYNTMVSKIDHLINEVYKKQLMIADMRFKMLQTQINPHFLYNTLETIHWKAEAAGHPDISVMVLSISNLLRHSISKVDVISLAEDIRLTDDYLRIQQIRFEERLVVTSDIPPEVLDARIPKMTLQPLVENSIRHNLEQYAGVCRIHLDCCRQPDRLIIRVCDNGRSAEIGHILRVLEGEAEARGSGLGLRNIHERIQLSFGDTYGLRIPEDQPSGLCVEVHLPPPLTVHEFEEESHA